MRGTVKDNPRRTDDLLQKTGQSIYSVGTSMKQEPKNVTIKLPESNWISNQL